jgi:flagellar basal-body rod protein FlgB
MPLNLDNYLGVHERALKLESRRTELLAANLANADTPGFKSRDIDFKTALASAGGNAAGTSSNASGRAAISMNGATPALTLTKTSSTHLSTAGGVPGVDNTSLKYRVPMAPALDGNTVDAQLEQSAFAENSVRYQATLTLLNGKLRSLMTAITGQ